jgi:hypothetical protein
VSKIKISAGLPISHLRSFARSNKRFPLDIANTDGLATSGRERRKRRRFNCDGQVEVNRIPSTGRRSGKLLDLSETGCLIEIKNPFACPSYVEIMLHTPAMRLRLTGTVRRTLKSGMGIEFDQLSTGGKRLLRDLIMELEQHSGRSYTV